MISPLNTHVGNALDRQVWKKIQREEEEEGREVGRMREGQQKVQVETAKETDT